MTDLRERVAEAIHKHIAPRYITKINNDGTIEDPVLETWDTLQLNAKNGMLAMADAAIAVVVAECAKVCEERMMAEGEGGEWLANVELRGAADEIRQLGKGKS